MASPAQARFEARLSKTAEIISAELGKLLDVKKSENNAGRSEQLVAAMCHAALNGGKRLRPFLVVECASLFGVKGKSAVRTATALECIHCYSLIHDDLPSMDDDDLRRGQPTVHKKWDEATAILAGDALQSIAFEILADPKTHKDADIRCQLVLQLARAAGVHGMAGGQMLDLNAEITAPNEVGIKHLQSLKTGALIGYACDAGAILGEASDTDRKALIKFGQLIGQAFQLTDDILDVTSTPHQMGKKTDKDFKRGKATLVSLYGLHKAQKTAFDLADEAIATLQPFGKRADLLAACAHFIVNRAK